MAKKKRRRPRRRANTVEEAREQLARFDRLLEEQEAQQRTALASSYHNSITLTAAVDSEPHLTYHMDQQRFVDR